MTRVWYTSDLHIGHKVVAAHRGFFDEDNVVGDDLHCYCPCHRDGGATKHVVACCTPPEAQPDTVAHDEWLADLWDSTVSKDDIVFVLGDISINGGQHALDWVAERPGVKHLIAGNHDPVHPLDRRAQNKMAHWMGYFASIQPFARRRLEGMNFLLCHFPYWPIDRGEPRYEQYRLPDLGLPLVHGHTHGTEREHGNMLHVGIDAWQSLVPQETILDWLTASKGTAT